MVRPGQSSGPSSPDVVLSRYRLWVWQPKPRIQVELVEETAGGFAEDSAVSALEEEPAQTPTAQDLCLPSVSTLHCCILLLQQLYPSETPPALCRSSSNAGAGAAELPLMPSASPSLPDGEHPPPAAARGRLLGWRRAESPVDNTWDLYSVQITRRAATCPERGRGSAGTGAGLPPCAGGGAWGRVSAALRGDGRSKGAVRPPPCSSIPHNAIMYCWY